MADADEVKNFLRKVKFSPVGDKRRKAQEPRDPEPVPELDEQVWSSWETGEAIALTVPDNAVFIHKILGMLMASRRYLAWKHRLNLADIAMDKEVIERGDPRLAQRGIDPPPPGHSVIVFKFRPKMEKGNRVHRRKIREQ